MERECPKLAELRNSSSAFECLLLRKQTLRIDISAAICDPNATLTICSLIVCYRVAQQISADKIDRLDSQLQVVINSLERQLSGIPPTTDLNILDPVIDEHTKPRHCAGLLVSRVSETGCRSIESTTQLGLSNNGI